MLISWLINSTFRYFWSILWFIQHKLFENSTLYSICHKWFGSFVFYIYGCTSVICIFCKSKSWAEWVFWYGSKIRYYSHHFHRHHRCIMDTFETKWRICSWKNHLVFSYWSSSGIRALGHSHRDFIRWKVELMTNNGKQQFRSVGLGADERVLRNLPRLCTSAIFQWR